MHLAITIISVIAASRYGDWKNFIKYYPTVLYCLCGELLYFHLYGDDALWNEIPDLGMTDDLTLLLYTFIIFPCTVVIFLSSIPSSKVGQLIHIIKWVAIYSVTEWIAYKLGRMTYNSGWNEWWSLAFNCIMFSMFRLHYTKPLRAAALSVPVAIILTMIFEPHWGHQS